LAAAYGYTPRLHPAKQKSNAALHNLLAERLEFS
jgi:hypothetical protein